MIIRHAETRSLVKVVLEGAGHRVIESNGYLQAQSLLSNGLQPDLMMVEPTPGRPAESLEFGQLLNCLPRHKFCLVLGIAQEELRKEASELGIRHFLRKPVTRCDLDALVDELRSSAVPEQYSNIAFSATEASAFTSSVSLDVPSSLVLKDLGDGRFFLAASPQMLEIHRQVKLLANADVPVLILGESGTGKDVIAHLIHQHSRRSGNRFLNVNCAALPADLLESELFGHQQGAFTGATRDMPGKFEQAHRGTLLLDEIGEMSPQMQAKLLHVIQDSQFTRLGGLEPTRIDVRVLAATNIQIERALKEKAFREDLYYRLSVFILNVPPLRERREEIPFLIDEIIRRTPTEIKRGGPYSFSSRVMDAVLLYHWPGNVRELRNFVTRTIILRASDSAVRELEAKIAATCESDRQDTSYSPPSHRSGMRNTVRDIKDRTEARMIQEALDVCLWNRRYTAQHLSISYRSLLYKIDQYQLAPKRAVHVQRSV